MENIFIAVWSFIEMHTWLWLILAVAFLFVYAKVITLEGIAQKYHCWYLRLSCGLCALLTAMFVMSLSCFSAPAGWTLLVNYGFLLFLTMLIMYGLLMIKFMIVLGSLFLGLMDMIFFGPKPSGKK